MNDVIWGPLNFVLDGDRANQVFGWVATCLIVLACMPVVVRRSIPSALLAASGLLGWLILGILGAGINV